MARSRRHFIREVYDRLEAHFGPTHWWPGDTPFEIAIGAILTQNTAWGNVEKALKNIIDAGKLAPQALLDCDDESLHDMLRPSGYFRVKAGRVRSFCRYLVDRCDGSMANMAQRPLAELRPELLGVHGIGPETADDILLYACEKPVFVVDAYTRRIFARHGMVERTIAYEPLRQIFEKNLQPDVHTFKEYHGLIVYTGKDFCRTVPRCEECPLKPMLKRGQPII